MAGRLSLFAGAGGLVPEAVAAALIAGYKVQVLTLTPRDDLGSVKVIKADVSDPLKILLAVKLFRTTHILMAGAIQLSDRTREALAKFATGGGAKDGTPIRTAGDQTMSHLATTLEKMTGAKVVGVHEIAPELLAPEGMIAGPVLDAERLADADFALRLAKELGRLDIGQAVVTTGRRVIAAEDIGGTDELLERVARYRDRGLTGDGSGPLVLAKAMKPDQPMFADLPAIGPQTIANAARAGVVLVVIEAGRAIIIDRPEVIAAAEAAGIGVVGRTLGN